MNSDLDQAERELDEKYQKAKEAFSIIRSTMRAFQAGVTPANASLPSVAPRIRERFSISHQVLEAAKGLRTHTFKMEDVAATLPEMERQKISNALNTLKEAGKIEMVEMGRGQKPAIYKITNI